jgi:hypothetical protein
MSRRRARSRRIPRPAARFSPVAGPRILKKGTVRPKDWGDAERIARRFGLKEK